MGLDNDADATTAIAGPIPRKAWRDSTKASPYQVLAIVCAAICLANLDLFVVNVGLPNIARDFRGASLEDLSWILNGYAIAYAALLVFFGRLAERHRRDLSFLAGVALFTAASAACAMATSVETLVAFRIAQAAGAALMTPTSLGLLLASFPAEKRASAVRAWTAIGGFAAALGPLVGGLLVTVSWRWIFTINVPIGLLAILAGFLVLPRVPGHDAPRPNLWAALLVTCGIGALTFAIVKANDWGWASAGIGASFALAIILLALFVHHCLRSANPFVDPTLFRVPPFTGAVLAFAPYGAAFGAMLLSIALWQQTAWGWSALKAGLGIAPGPLLVPITSLLFAGRLIARFGAAAVATAGAAFFALGSLLWATTIGAEPSIGPVIGGMICTGVGVGLTFPTLMGIGTASLPPSSFATGSAVITMIRQAAIAIGVALFVAIVGTPLSLQERVAAYHRAWWIVAALSLLSIIPTQLIIGRRRSPRPVHNQSSSVGKPI
jgi:EmrB/QacA subfamily drug resistance transporter